MKKKKIVFHHDGGFTLLEVILNIMLLSIIMLFVPLVFHSLKTIDQVIQIEEDYEWNLFLIGLRDELKSADHVHVIKPYLFIEQGPIKIQYVQHGLVIRRQVNNTGHEIVLQNVKSTHFTKNEGSLYIQVEFLSGIREDAYFKISKGEEELQL